jgi:predicted esterase
MVGKQAQELRQHLTTKVPVLVEYGSADDTIPPGRMACVIDRFKQDKVPYTFCLRPGFGHEGILRQAGSDVVDGIASQTMGEPAPPA